VVTRPTVRVVLGFLAATLGATGQSCSPPLVAPTPQAGSATALEERHELLTLAAVASAYVGRDARPIPGYTIAALIAWDVDNLQKTPEFVLDRNRNFEFQGDIHHAEINTIRQAYAKKRRYDLAPSAGPEERYQAYGRTLADVTLYTSLEPCPMCAMTMLLSRVPKAIYFMEDPGLRDPVTRATRIVLPDSVYGRTLVQVRSGLVEATTSNRLMWSAAENSKRFSITDYLSASSEDLLGPAYRRLKGTTTQFPENVDLLHKLKAAVGEPLKEVGERK
jgi:tRNA(Arg) A34 adenosine deaminase TadA